MSLVPRDRGTGHGCSRDLLYIEEVETTSEKAKVSELLVSSRHPLNRRSPKAYLQSLGNVCIVGTLRVLSRGTFAYARNPYPVGPMPKPDCGAQREREKGGGPLKVGRLSKTKHDSLIPALQTTSDALVPEPPEGGPGHGRDKGGEKKV